MQNNPLTERDLRQRLSVPPTFDVGHHLREVARVLLPALLGALIIAGVVYQMVASKPPVYQNTVTATIESGALTGMTDVTVNMLAPPFVALSQSRVVLEEVAKRAHIDTPPEQLARDITLSVQQSPSLVQVTSRASTAEGAIALSDAAVSALDTAMVNVWIDRVTKGVQDLQESAAATAGKMVGLLPDSPEHQVLQADFDSQLERAKLLQSTPPTRIVLLSQPDTAEKVAPQPLRQTMVAFIVGLLVLAELLAFLNGRVGRRTNAAWVRRQAHRRGYSIAAVGAGKGKWPLDTQVLLNTTDTTGPEILTLRSSAPRSEKFVESAVADTDGAGLAVHSIDDDWWREPDVGASPLAIAVVDHEESDRKRWGRTFAALDRYGMPVQVVLLAGKRCGRHHKPTSTSAADPDTSAEEADAAEQPTSVHPDWIPAAEFERSEAR